MRKTLFFIGTALGLVLGSPAAASAADPRRRQGARHAEVRHQHRPRRLRLAGRQRQVAGLRRRALLRHRRRGARRRREGRVHARPPARPASPRWRSGEIDVLVRNSTWTFTRDVDLGFTFTGVNYYDGQGFMVSKELGVASAMELDGATVCIQTGTTTELNLVGLLQGQRHDLPAGADPDECRGRPAVPGRRLRRLHHRRLGPRGQPRHLRGSRRTGSSCRRSSPRSRSGRWCARATTSGPTSCAGR